MTVRQARIEKGLTQNRCAQYLGIPVRTYKRYEADESRIDPIRYRYIMDRLNEYGRVDEEHGILTTEQIKAVCSEIFGKYDVEYAYLFGSYAKAKATESSDVDLLVSVPVDGLKYYELLENLREGLKKNVDLLDVGQLDGNPLLVREILRDGVRIYG